MRNTAASYFIADARISINDQPASTNHCCPCFLVSRLIYPYRYRGAQQLREEDYCRTINDLKGGISLVKHTVGTFSRMKSVRMYACCVIVLRFPPVYTSRCILRVCMYVRMRVCAYARRTRRGWSKQGVFFVFVCSPVSLLLLSNFLLRCFPLKKQKKHFARRRMDVHFFFFYLQSSSSSSSSIVDGIGTHVRLGI